METKQLELNESEATALVHLIDIAVKQDGLRVSKAATILSEKVIELFKKEETVEMDGIDVEEPKKKSKDA